MSDRQDFTLGGYAGLISALAARGYDVRGYETVEPNKSHLILRHDLDMSIDAAVPVAQIERELGVSAHYFVLLRTEMYNPWSKAGRANLERIADLGHTVGLHLDASLYADDADALEDACAVECAALEHLIGREVAVVSLHRPAPSLLGLDRRLAGRYHAYQPRFFSDIGYCSDSRGEWRHGHPMDHEAVAKGTALQLLTHPIWWQRMPAETSVDVLKRFAADRDRLLHRELAANCEPYGAAFDDGERE